MPLKKRYVLHSEFARIFGISQAAVHSAVRNKKIKSHRRQGRSVIDVLTEVPRFISGHPRIKGVAMSRGELARYDIDPDFLPPEDPSEDNSGIVDAFQARQRFEIIKAKTAEMEYERKRGQLVELEVIEREWLGVAVRIRKSLAGIADRMTPLVVAETDARKIHEALSAEADQILEDLSRELYKYIEETEENETEKNDK